MDSIRINNLNNGVLNDTSIEIPVGDITVLAGPSGSGLYDFFEPVLVKHSKKIYGDMGEGGLSFLEQSSDIDIQIEGLPPVINFLEWEERPKGDVGDYLRISAKLADVFFRLGHLCCPICSSQCSSYSVEEAVNYLKKNFLGKQIIILAPLIPKFLNRDDFQQELIRQGFTRIRASGEIIRLDESRSVETAGPVDVVVDRIKISENSKNRLTESIYNSREISRGFTYALFETDKRVTLNQQSSCSQCEYVFPEENRLKLLEKFKIRHVAWPDVKNWTIGESLKFLQELDSNSYESLQHIGTDLGINAIQISQTLKTLSSSEWQRVRLVAVLGLGLSGLLYVFHGIISCVDGNIRKNVISVLQRLADQGNTILLVDSSKEAQRLSGTIFECRKGKFEKVTTILDSLPENFNKKISGLPFRIVGNGKWTQIDFKLFSASIIGISGKSSAGKSSFIREIIAPALKEEKNSNYKLFFEGPYSFTQVFRKVSGGRIVDFLGISNIIANLFVQTKRGIERGYPKDFYRLDKIGGRCPSCEGSGMIKFLDGLTANEQLVCSVCDGMRFKDEILEVTFNGTHIAKALQMSIKNAAKFFRREKKINEILEKCCEIGLNEIILTDMVENLGPYTSRAIQLAFPSKSKKMSKTHFFVIDNPCCGAHPEDVSLLLQQLTQLCNMGATIFITIDHEGIRSICDQIVDISSNGSKKAILS